MAKNGMANYGRIGRTVDLTHMPDRKREYIVNFTALTGGLNLYSPDYQLDNSESPDMENMLWKDGTLCSRPGQRYLSDSTKYGVGYTCYDGLYWDNSFYHIGSGIYYGPLGDEVQLVKLCDLSSYYSNYTPARGTFFRYGDDLMYKAPGVFIRIGYNGSGFTVSDVAAEAYTPITYINADWYTGAGDSYQPENRISAKKTVWYDAGLQDAEASFSGDGSKTEFNLTSITDFHRVEEVTVDGATYANWDLDGTTLKFYTAPAKGTNNVRVYCKQRVKTYQLPVKGSDVSIVSVTVDGAATTKYSFDSASGVITFTEAPAVANPFYGNTVRVTYSKPNPDAFNSVMGCPHAIVYGGDQNICIVVGGCTAQPNAFFWNGNNVAMDASYWPMEHYNLGGDTEDMVTGFGKQQGYLVVFKSRSLGKCEMSFTTVDMGSSDITARVYIAMNYTNINSKTGCDLPWSIQLVENNLVFCNTEQGIHVILDTSPAYENNVQHISTKINGSETRAGLLRDVRAGGVVCSCDDNSRYWLTANGHVWCWDYVLSTYQNPSFFYFTGINAVSYFTENESIYHMDAKGRVTGFEQSFTDYGAAYKRRYQFATQMFGSYDRLKDVVTAIFAIRMDTDSRIKVTYITDYERRDDLTPVEAMSYRLSPRNLTHRYMYPIKFAYVARRRPGCRHVRHFALLLTCEEPGYDMPILSAQIFYRFEGRDR